MIILYHQTGNRSGNTGNRMNMLGDQITDFIQCGKFYNRNHVIGTCNRLN